jgi:ubiquinone/menaquinone biosynthesis C-methylase UbiE
MPVQRLDRMEFLTDSPTSSYVIDGGRSGAARLAVLARVRASASEDFMRRAGLRAGHRCVDLGCGSGELTYRLAELAAPGEVVGVDFDRGVVGVATERAAQAPMAPGPRFILADVHALPEGLGRFDLISARYLLGHLRDPLAVLRTMRSLLVPGGVVAVEDTNVDAMSAEPRCPALERCIELNRALTRARGLPHRLGPRLAGLLARAGYEGIEESVDQEVTRDGEGKRLTEMTLERKRSALIEAGLTDDAEIDALLAELRRFSADPRTLVRSPRLYQVLGRRPVRA